MNINNAIKSAVENYQAGNLQQAENVCKKILKIDSGNITAINLLGIIYYQVKNYDSAVHCMKKLIALDPNNAQAYYIVGHSMQEKKQIDEAINYYQKALQINPDFADAYYNLGTIFQDRKREDEAINCYQKTLQMNPADVDACYNLGRVLQEKKQFDEAITYYQKALQINPNLADAYNNIGIILQEKNQFDEAITYYQKALQINPNLAGAYNNIGIILKEKGQFDKAMSYCQKALELDPEFYKAYHNLGGILQEKNRFDEAMDCYRKALELKPDIVEAYIGIGFILQEKNRFDEAMDCYRKALELKPDIVEAYIGIGFILQEKNRFDEAMDCYRKALELKPDIVEAYIGIGFILQEKNRLDEAMDCHRKALQTNPDNAAAHLSLGFALLEAGNFIQGWKEYEWRWETKDFLRKSCYRRPTDFSQPLWDGSSLEGKTIFIFSEQGVGDEIMFASCFQDVIEQADLCTVECEKRLIPIFRRSFPKAVFVERPDKAGSYSSQHPASDFVLPVGSLPNFLRPDFSSFPQEKPYLIPDTEKVRFWHDRLKTLGEGLKVGISWRGGKTPGVIRKRSINLEMWIKIFSLSGVHFINLQYGDCAKELIEVKEKLGVTIHDWEDADPLKDLDNFAAQISALDLVISVDNSTVHMAGALGVPVWTLLPLPGDWRWMREFEDTPWYPTMRLFRQSSPDDWDEVFERVYKTLKDLVGQRNMSSNHWTSFLKCSYMNVIKKDVAGPNNQPALSDKIESERNKYLKAWDMDNRVYAHYSPGLELSNRIDFLNFFRMNNVKTVLDAGIGSGKLCKKMIGMGFECHGLDIADNSLDEDLLPLKDSILTVGTLWDGTVFKEDRFDATVCMDVLEHIPTDYIANVIDNLVRWTKKYVFLQIALFHDCFGSKVGETLHLTVEPKSWWDAKLSKFKIIQDIVLKNDKDEDIYVIYLIEVA